MTEREQAMELAKQILNDRRDLDWLAPLAREFMALVKEHEQAAHD